MNKSDSMKCLCHQSIKRTKCGCVESFAVQKFKCSYQLPTIYSWPLKLMHERCFAEDGMVEINSAEGDGLKNFKKSFISDINHRKKHTKWDI